MMYTEAERAEMMEQERRDDMTYDATGRARVAAARNNLAEHRQQLAAERAARNPDLAARLAAIKARMNDGNQLIAQIRTRDLMRLQDCRVVSSSTEPTPFDRTDTGE